MSSLILFLSSKQSDIYYFHFPFDEWGNWDSKRIELFPKALSSILVDVMNTLTKRKGFTWLRTPDHSPSVREVVSNRSGNQSCRAHWCQAGSCSASSHTGQDRLPRDWCCPLGWTLTSTVKTIPPPSSPTHMPTGQPDINNSSLVSSLLL